MKPDSADNPPQSDPVSEPQRTVQATLLLYVTGALTEQEAEAFESRLLTNEEFASRVDAAEIDLLDDYAVGLFDPTAGEQPLSPTALQLLEQWIEGSSVRREHVRLTRLLRSPRPTTRKTVEVAEGQAVAPAARRRSLRLLGLAAAACLLVVAGLLLLTQRRAAVPAPSVATAPHAPVPTGSSAHPARHEDVILLAAERLRGGQTQKPGSYLIHAGSPVRLQVLVPSSATHDVYSLSVRREHDRSPSAVFPGLTLKKEGDLQYVEAVLTAGELTSGMYIVKAQASGTLAEFQMKITLQ